MSPSPPRPGSVPELDRSLRAMNDHLEQCPDCLRWGYELCDRGLLLSNAVIRARAAREAFGLPPGGAEPPNVVGVRADISAWEVPGFA